MTENDHPTPESIERFILGQLSPMEMRDIARHLLTGCPECNDATSRLWEPEDVFEEAETLALVGQESSGDEASDGYDQVLDRVFEKVIATEAMLAEQRVSADHLFEHLMQCPAERRSLLLANSQRFRNRLLCERLIEDSHGAGFENPLQALESAQLAVIIADRLDLVACGDLETYDGLRARAWAQLGNAFRVNADFLSAEKAFSTSEALLAEGRVPLLDKARVLAQLATLRKDQGRFSDAIELFDRVVSSYRKLGQWGLLGRALLQKALVLGECGDGEAEMKLLRQSLDLIDPEADPRLFLVARHNLINALNESGRSREAFALLFHTRPLYLKMGDRRNLLRLRWLEGLVALGLNRIEQAETAFREVRDGFNELGLDYDTALASLDLARVYILRGRTADVRYLAEETLTIFQARSTHRQALAALLVFCSAAQLDQVGADLVREVSTFLKRARNNPDLQFSPIAS